MTLTSCGPVATGFAASARSHPVEGPELSDMPVMRKHSFDIRASSLDEAVSNIRTRIDLLLDILR